MKRRVPAVVLALFTGATPAAALTLLTAGKVGVFRSDAGRPADAVVRATGDRALRRPPDPTCPATSSLRFALSRRGDDFEDHGAVSLPCTGWRRTPGGYRYTAPLGRPGGVRSVVLGRGRLRVRAGGAGFTPIMGPVAYVEAWLVVGNEAHLVRLQRFRRNEATRIESRRPTRIAAAGEAAFWDTLWADRRRSDEALRLLRHAVRQDPADGRSQFLLGMLHLYRSGEACPTFDLTSLCAAGRDEGLAAVAPLDRAVDLLPEDTRIAGFRAAATYAAGFVTGDAARVDLGLRLIDAAVATNALFNSFDLFAVVAPVTPGGSAYYQDRVLPLVDAIFRDNVTCPTTIPEICGDAGMAPHNFEGTLLLLGDIYAKGGRLASAATWYAIGQGVGSGNGYRYESVLDERVANVEARVALYRDADPANDPALVGGGGASCVYCHNK
jgi:hypothetical protein